MRVRRRALDIWLDVRTEPGTGGAGAAARLPVWRPNRSGQLDPKRLVGEILRIVGHHVPPPTGLRSPTYWGTEDGLAELFANGIVELQATRLDFVWRFASAQQYLDLFRTYYGPVHKAFGALDGGGQDALARELVAAVERCNRATDGTLLVPAEYLEAVAVTR